MRKELTKSQTAKRVARLRGIRFVEVPLSMMEASDLRGLPTTHTEAQALHDGMVRDRAIGDHKL